MASEAFVLQDHDWRPEYDWKFNRETGERHYDGKLKALITLVFETGSAPTCTFLRRSFLPPAATTTVAKEYQLQFVPG